MQNISNMTEQEIKEQQARAITAAGEGMAVRFTREIGNAANKKWNNGATMSTLVTSLVLEKFVIFVTSRLYPLGTKEGHDLIVKTYDGIKKDALNKWGYSEVDEE